MSQERSGTVGKRHAIEDYQCVLEAHCITCSMSRRGNSLDNAAT